jgi:tRNA-2-methylthio-N6-dimethylallyladenosine synthase
MKQKTFYIRTFGCQMNFHDSEKISGLLISEQFSDVENPANADVIIFNTCSIRQKAEQKFFSELGKIKALKKKNPNLKIIVAGCIAQHQGDKIFERASHVDYVVGPQNIGIIKDIINQDNRFVSFIEDNSSITELEIPAYRKSIISAMVNIMYGCNNFCSYCVVPYTRGREKSRATQSIINEIKKLADNGYKEILLLGQNVNSYYSDTDFPGLLKKINDIKGIERIRFVTSHPKDLSDDLIFSIRDLEKVCEHIHLPLQSGSNKILSLMNRKYTYEDYLEKIEKLRKNVPKIAITSDIIAGFPKESDEDHIQTIRALKEIEFDGIFSFKFSPRKGTFAAELDGQIPDEIKAKRLYEILELQNLITEKKNRTLKGSVEDILIEDFYEKDKNKLIGRTRSNKIVIIPKYKNINIGDIVKIKITETHRHSLEGDLLKHEDFHLNTRVQNQSG